MAKKEEKREFILKDFSRHPIEGDLLNKRLSSLARPNGKWSGYAIVGTPFEAHEIINFTGPIGAASGVYYGLVFQLGKWEYNGIQKFDEWIEVSPVHTAYYQLTMKQKEELENRIKAGLIAISQSVADLELLLHDKRRYEEMLNYLGYESKEIDGIRDIDFIDESDSKKKAEREKRVDNHSLKAMFIDQVDIHTGEGISMRNIVQRWPTLISDFMRLDDNDIDPDKVRTKLDISRAEAVILVTKNKLYQEWKKIFLPDVVTRYKRIMSLVRSRQKSIEEYREWIKPFIARHKLIKEGLSDAGARKSFSTLPYTTSGHPSSSQRIVLWVWKDFQPPEIYKTPSEISALKPLEPDDEWTRSNLIYHNTQGLIVEYPWINDKWIKEQKEQFFSPLTGWMKKNRHYYSFFQITFTRNVFRTPQGEEMEDADFDVNLVFMSQNVLFVKLLELKAKQEEFERYVNNMLGIPYKVTGEGEKPNLKKMSGRNPIIDIFSKLNISLQFMKHGPYERDFNDRISKYYLAPIAGERYVPIINFIKSRIGLGT